METTKQEPNGIIVKSNAGLYDVFLTADKKVIQTKSRGVLRHQNKQPIVGDRVCIEVWEETPVIAEIFPRKNELIRPLVANIDACVVVISVKEPDFAQYLLDKYLALLEFNHIAPIIVFTKYDLLSAAETGMIKDIETYYQKIGYPIFHVKREVLLDKVALNQALSGKITAIMGQTGVGKTTLLNDLSDGIWQLETNEISEALGRGKHTTRIVELFPIADYWIADTPGFSAFHLSEIPVKALTQTFIEFSEYPCQFSDCVHVNEKKCGVKTAVEQDAILPARYKSYLKLYAELKTQEEEKKW